LVRGRLGNGLPFYFAKRFWCNRRWRSEDRRYENC
jgi:hypothetical protein